MKQLTVQANAKVNLTLGIIGKRDDGYHYIDTIMQSVGLSDFLTVSESDTLSVECSISGIDEKNNIAYRAAQLFFEECGINAGAEIIIEKNIPAAAGLGGGSADAAAVLCALDKIYGTGLSYEKLCELALKLGADVPFFIKGGTQRAEGIGEKLTLLPSLEKGAFLLLKSDSKPSTAEMYKRLDATTPPLPDTDKAVKAISDNDVKTLADNMVNSFTAVWNGRGKERFFETKPLGTALSGSGPVWFGLYDNFESAAAAEALLKSDGVFCRAVKPCNFGIKID